MVGHFNPGDAVGFQLGSILALNPEVSMTMGWDQRFTRSTTLNGDDIPASYLVEGTLRLGTSYVYARGRTMDLSFGVGLTPDTPNLQFSVGVPFRYDGMGSEDKETADELRVTAALVPSLRRAALKRAGEESRLPGS